MATDLETYRDELRQGRGKRSLRRRRDEIPWTHKKRASRYRAREAWPFRELSGEILAEKRARTERETTEAAPQVVWSFAGPSNIGGRMTAIVVHPIDPNRVVAAAAGGGVWRSTDAGNNWESLWHNEPTLNIGALAIDPNEPNVIFCGTGEANLSADSHPGVGVFITRDGGDNWALLAASTDAGIPNRIGTIAVDPFNSDHVLLGGVSHAFSDVREGLYVSLDGGGTWNRENGITSGRYRCHQVLFDPVNQGIIYATITASGFLSGVWRSDDGGTTWTHLVTDLPHPSFIRRGAIAIAPSNPDRIFIQLATSDGGVLGIFSSDDQGGHWREISGQHFRNERQMNYNNTIVVHPTDPDHVLCGGVDIHRTRNGGQTWQRVTDWAADRGTPRYAHADQHALIMPAAQPGRVYAGNDGGLDLSEDGGTSWANRSDGLAVTMYYDLEIAQSDSNMYGGGCQDNGTNITVSGNSNDHFMISGGDGGWMTIDPTDALHIYASSQGMRILRFRSHDGWNDVSPLPANSAERRSMWMVYIAMDPNDPTRVFTGTRRVWRTINDGDTWNAVSGNLDNSEITAIEIARANSNHIYVGTENSGIFHSDDGGDNWTGDISGPLLPGNTITRLRTDPNDANAVYATIANAGHGHVFRSPDGGVTWQDLDGGQLPDVPHHSIAISTRDTNHLFVANDVGVFGSLDGGANWRSFKANLPNVTVIDLVYHSGDDHLFAATYGRSLWRLDLAGL